jgi:hypothetical protein
VRRRPAVRSVDGHGRRLRARSGDSFRGRLVRHEHDVERVEPRLSQPRLGVTGHGGNGDRLPRDVAGIVARRRDDEHVGRGTANPPADPLQALSQTLLGNRHGDRPAFPAEPSEEPGAIVPRPNPLRRQHLDAASQPGARGLPARCGRGPCAGRSRSPEDRPDEAEHPYRESDDAPCTEPGEGLGGEVPLPECLVALLLHRLDLETPDPGELEGVTEPCRAKVRGFGEDLGGRPWQVVAGYAGPAAAGGTVCHG